MDAKTIKEALIGQLKAKKADTPYFVEMVENYMGLRGQLRAMKAAVKTAGLYETEVYHNAGDTRLKANPMLKEIRETQKQMLAILKELKLSVDTVISEEEDDGL